MNWFVFLYVLGMKIVNWLVFLHVLWLKTMTLKTQQMELSVWIADVIDMKVMCNSSDHGKQYQKEKDWR